MAGLGLHCNPRSLIPSLHPPPPPAQTSIIQRFQDDGFKKLYKQTVGCDFFEKTMDFRGKTVKTQIWDIGGQSLSSKNLPNYVLGSSVLFLCYDVTDPQSFGDLVDWLAMIRKAYDEKNKALEMEAKKDAKEVDRTKVKKAKGAKKERMPEIYCVGNKIDLIEFRRVTEKQVRVCEGSAARSEARSKKRPRR